VTQLPFDIDLEQLAAFCRRHHIRRLAVFGYAVSGEFTADSDIDVLVEFEPGAMVSREVV
jgi:uncharacterized protein